MLIIVIIFFIALITAFGMLTFRAWEIRTSKIDISNLPTEEILPDLSFRHVEKSMLYLTKHILQSILLVVVKYWFTMTTKSKKWLADKWPKVHVYFEKKARNLSEPQKTSFFKKAIIESKTKIRKIKEKVKREHEEINEELK